MSEPLVKMSRYKVLSTDNYAREHIADRVLCENQGYDEAKAITERLQAEVIGADSARWYKFVPQDAPVWRGMAEFVDDEEELPIKQAYLWMVASNVYDALESKFTDGPSPNWRDLAVGMTEGNLLIGQNKEGVTQVVYILQRSRLKELDGT